MLVSNVICHSSLDTAVGKHQVVAAGGGGHAAAAGACDDVAAAATTAAAGVDGNGDGDNGQHT